MCGIEFWNHGTADNKPAMIDILLFSDIYFPKQILDFVNLNLTRIFLLYKPVYVYKDARFYPDFFTFCRNFNLF